MPNNVKIFSDELISRTLHIYFPHARNSASRNLIIKFDLDLRLRSGGIEIRT